MTSPIAPALDPAVSKLRNIRDLASLVTYLHEELEWPVAEYDFEDLVYDVTPQEAGLDAATEAKVRSIKRLRPLSNDQPWGIFFIDFVPGDLPITVLRRILRAVSIKKREQGRADRKAWQTDDLLFISVLGEEGDRDLNLAHFNDDPAAKRATLRVVEWDAADTAFAILRTHNELKNLAWRQPAEDDDAWRARWASAFALRPREVAQTAKALASQMAQLAKLIRERVNEAIKVEAKEGPLRELHAAFKEVLLHDLTEDGFADMYAQTMTYGLFAARQSRPMGITLDNAVDMIPNTNPFLRDLLAQFTTAAGLTHSLDFDELGVDALIDALNKANMEAVVDDFGKTKQGEDPVIHFYEDFLREYNKAQKIQRGVFYTPKPVVSFIVRSVHELLQTEFQLPDGLASTETWGDMVAKFPDLKIPEGATPATPFVQVLDPACGTGTFLVEVIDVIHRTLTEKWKREGHMPLEFDGLWNEYVPKHLLPRIYGFELMMASYTIAHMKVGLKLGELGYKFAAAERLRIYLTNTLEPPQDFRGMFDIMAPALAHEARAVNEVKQTTRFTVIVGNPPYSGESENRGVWIHDLMRRRLPDGADSYFRVDGADLGEKNPKWLNDDYVKFFRLSQWCLAASGVGALSFISNHGYVDNPTFRGMRASLMASFAQISVLDLHGNLNKKELTPQGLPDGNVFEIQQGVAIAVLNKPPSPRDTGVRRAEVFGTREEKYEFLNSESLSSRVWSDLSPSRSQYLFVPEDRSLRTEFERGPALSDVFARSNVGIVTARDGLTIHWNREGVWDTVREFAALDEEAARRRFTLGDDVRDWRVAWAQADVRKSGPSRRRIAPIVYRPFDVRFTYYTGVSRGFICYPRSDVMSLMLSEDALAIVTTRQTRDDWAVMCTNHMIGHKALAAYDINSLFPLGPPGQSNMNPLFLASLTATAGRLPTPGDAFRYVLAVLSAPSFKARFLPLLKSEYPHVPIPANADLFRNLVKSGDELVVAQTLRGVSAGCPEVPSAPATVTKTEFSALGSDTLGWVVLGAESRFGPLPAEVWSFQFGGYQPAQKWLKDRRGRVLTDEDIEHYKRIIGAITETIRIQKEIDEVIEAHGGWPAAFQGGEAE